MSGHERLPKPKQEENPALHLIPDWRNGKTYPQPEDLNDTFWRWRFLRRRSDFRQEWEKSYPSSYAFDRACAGDPAYPTRFRKRTSSPAHTAFRARMPVSLENIISAGCRTRQLLNPGCCPSIRIMAGCISVKDRIGWRKEKKSICVNRNGGWRVAAMVDLKKSLLAQMEGITSDLMKWQEYQMGRNIKRKCRDNGRCVCGCSMPWNLDGHFGKSGWWGVTFQMRTRRKRGPANYINRPIKSAFSHVRSWIKTFLSDQKQCREKSLAR